MKEDWVWVHKIQKLNRERLVIQINPKSKEIIIYSDTKQNFFLILSDLINLEKWNSLC